jgi:hypothetical protein
MLLLAGLRPVERLVPGASHRVLVRDVLDPGREHRGVVDVHVHVRHAAGSAAMIAVAAVPRECDPSPLADHPAKVPVLRPGAGMAR